MVLLVTEKCAIPNQEKDADFDVRSIVVKYILYSTPQSNILLYPSFQHILYRFCIVYRFLIIN